ncbi:MAG: cyclopropane-fatty-acyl-phospholipid synthase family protein [Vicinamibacterales bacterium]
MESFSAEWLALREPVDHAARADALVNWIGARLDPSGGPRALDLACGTGSNVRYLAPKLAAIRQWTLVDHDAVLLDLARHLALPDEKGARARVETARLDLRDLDALPIAGHALVTAAALLDLVSADWLDGLVDRCRAAGAGVLFALSYDGRIECRPADEWDARIRDLVNEHQVTDKGFGPALGPAAAAAAAERLARAGYDVETAASDWVLDARQAPLVRLLLDGWAGAARAISPADGGAIADWRVRADRRLDAGLKLHVGHTDVAAARR